jgi:hypothetical protein
VSTLLGQKKLITNAFHPPQDWSALIGESRLVEGINLGLHLHLGGWCETALCGDLGPHEWHSTPHGRVAVGRQRAQKVILSLTLGQISFCHHATKCGTLQRPLAQMHTHGGAMASACL